MKKYLDLTLIFLALAGFADAIYLTIEHFSGTIPPCTAALAFSDCGLVLRSNYAVILGVPLALIGSIHYFVLFLTLFHHSLYQKKQTGFLALILTLVGLIGSIYFVYLQLFVIRSLCPFCMLSALICLLLFIGTQMTFSRERKILLIYLTAFAYQKLVKPVMFLIDSEVVHNQMTRFGELLGKSRLIKWLFNFAYKENHPSLARTIAGIKFPSPVGLAAGFDYEAKLTQITSSIGFGFQSVGTITNNPYEGNPTPRLGRLPKSKSLMVNKGFKNLGAKATAKKLKRLNFNIPIGISIGRTNTLKLKTQKQSVADIISAFKVFERAKIKNSYYELNISCPNLVGNITFYPLKNLKELLDAVDKLSIKKPIFVKMPIEKSNQDFLAMLRVIAKSSMAGVIIGNLQKDRSDKAFDQEEVKKFPVGNFSGKPTFNRSNELIKLTYKYYKKRLIIIGCGGIFNTNDAYTKLKLGASLVQLITGIIYQGPLLPAEINFGLEELLKKNDR